MADRTVTYRLRAELGQFTAQMAQASASTKKLATDLTSMDKGAIKQRRGLETVGSAAGKFGLVAAAGLGAAVLKAANFDEAMSHVQAATHETAGNMEELRQAALKAGADTAFSATEAASGIEELSKAGVSTQDILAGGLSGALDLAAAGGLEVGEAAETAASALTQFKLSGEDVPHVADLLAAGAGKAQGSVHDLGMALNQTGLVASQVGLSIEETSAALASMASAGLIGSDAGTSFKTFLLRLTPQTKEAKDAMEALGFSAYDAQGNFVGLESVAGQLQSALSGMSAEQRTATLQTIFGTDAIRAANVLYEQGADGIASWTAKVDDSGYAAETAATRLDNLKGDLEQLGGSLETALIGTGSGSQGPLRSLVQSLTDVVNAYNKLPCAAQGAVGGLLGAGALLGGSVWLGSKLVRGIADTREALSNLGIEAGKTKGAIKNIGTAAAGFTAILVTADLVQAAFDKIANTRIDTGNLSRDIEALADDRITGNLDNLVNVFEDIQNKGQHDWNPLTRITFGHWDPSGFEAAQGSINALDESLASLVEGGEQDTAAAAFEHLADKAAETGLSTKELTDLFPEYRTALKNTADAADEAADSTKGATRANGFFSKATATASNRAERMSKALKDSREAAHDTAGQFFNLGGKVDKAKVSLGGWLKSLEKQAAALRDFRINAEKAAKRGLDEGLIRSLEEAGPAGALRMKQLANATDEQIGRANKAWQAGQREIQRYTDAIGGVPPKVHTDVDANTGGALTGIDLVASKLRALDGSVATTYVDYVRRNRVSGGVQRYSGGGDVVGPGTATSDSIPARLSDGEFVMRTAAVDYYGADFMHAVNAMAFADGGMVAARPASTSSHSRTVERVVETLPRGRVVAHIEGFGDVAMRFVDDRIGDYRHSDRLQAATISRGVTDD